MVPAFLTGYNLVTTVQGAWKTALQPLLRILSPLLTLRLVCLGSPLTDLCHLGFAPALAPGLRKQVTGRLLQALERFAASQAIGLLAAKDLADAHLGPGLAEAFEQAGYSRQPSLPNAVLALPHTDEEAYLKSLSQGTRREVRRKQKRAGTVRVELRRGSAAIGVVPELLRLYDRQRSRSGVDFDQFETLTKSYFRNVLAAQSMTAIVFLYTQEDALVAFNLCYHTDRLFIDKFVGFHDRGANKLDLYILSWMTNVRYCLEHGIGSLQTGQTGYTMKRRMGSVLEPTWIFFRHRNRLVNFILRLAAPLLAPDRYDETIAPPRAATR